MTFDGSRVRCVCPIHPNSGCGIIIFLEAHSGSTSNLQKAFHLFSNRPDQYYQIPSDIRNDSEKSDEYLAKIWKEVAKNITNNNEVNESVIIDITGGFNI